MVKAGEIMQSLTQSVSQSVSGLALLSYCGGLEWGQDGRLAGVYIIIIVWVGGKFSIAERFLSYRSSLRKKENSDFLCFDFFGF